ncbi:MAG: disulfide oxidoreductase [Acidimicrobiia bacterium]
MDVTSFNLLFALLALAAMAGALVGVLTLLVPAAPLRDLRLDIAATAPWFAFAIAAVATAGSLYYSEVAGFTPCKLCWFQRICMYPQALVLGIAAVRRDRSAWQYALPLSVLGAGISIYHYQLQRFPAQTSGFCTLEAPCTAKEVDQFGFVTIPFMALSGFLLISVLLLVGRTRPAQEDLVP